MPFRFALPHIISSSVSHALSEPWQQPGSAVGGTHSVVPEIHSQPFLFEFFTHIASSIPKHIASIPEQHPGTGSQSASAPLIHEHPFRFALPHIISSSVSHALSEPAQQPGSAVGGTHSVVPEIHSQPLRFEFFTHIA